MKFLIITVAFFGACFAQEHHARKYHQQQQQQQQQQHQQQQQYEQQRQQHHQPHQQQHQEEQHQQYQQPQQQHQEHRPRHESTTYIPIIRFDKEQGVDGTYKALWETGNNILAQEEGYLKVLGPDPDQKGENIHAQVQQGSYTYQAPNGETIVTQYTADETGFHVFGDHLPTPPPVSPEVQKGLDLIFAGIRQQQEQASREEPHSKQNQDHHAPHRQQHQQQQQPNQIPQEYNRPHPNPNQYRSEYDGQQQHQRQ